MGEALSTVHHRTKFLFIFVPVKLENNLSAPQIQWWYKQRITVIGTPIQNEKNGRTKEVTGPKQFRNPAEQTPLHLKILELFSVTLGSVLWAPALTLWVPPFIWKVVWFLPACRIFRVQQAFFHFIFSLPLSIWAGEVSIHITFSKTLWISCICHTDELH